MARRSLIVPPVFHVGSAEKTRKATWLELFFDLAYVAAVIELGYVLTDDVSWQGIANFVFLFIPLWWSWVGTTFYANRFDSDDLIHRILVFLQIFALSSLAINIEGGVSDRFSEFAISYAVVRFLFILMYVRAYFAVPEARPLSRRYLIGFSLAAVLWLIAAFLPESIRLVVAGLAIVVDFATVLSPRTRELQGQLPPSPSHLPERFGLFTIIVLGELFLKVTRELSGDTSPIGSWIAGFSLFTVAVGLWWLYFNRIAEGKVRWGGWNGLEWLFAHLPLHIGLTAFGVGFSKVVLVEEGDHLHDEYRLLAFGAIALCLGAITLLERFLDYEDVEPGERIETVVRAAGIVVLLGVAVFGAAIDHVWLSIIAALVLIAQVGMNIYRWLNGTGDADDPAHFNVQSRGGE